MKQRCRCRPSLELHLRQIARYCQQRVAEHARDQVQVSSRIRGRSVTIVERGLNVWQIPRNLELYLADISVPPVVWARLGLEPPSAFGTHTIARIGVTPASGGR